MAIGSSPVGLRGQYPSSPSHRPTARRRATRFLASKRWGFSHRSSLSCALSAPVKEVGVYGSINRVMSDLVAHHWGEPVDDIARGMLSPAVSPHPSTPEDVVTSNHQVGTTDFGAGCRSGGLLQHIQQFPITVGLNAPCFGNINQRLTSGGDHEGG